MIKFIVAHKFYNIFHFESSPDIILTNDSEQQPAGGIC